MLYDSCFSCKCIYGCEENIISARKKCESLGSLVAIALATPTHCWSINARKKKVKIAIDLSPLLHAFIRGKTGLPQALVSTFDNKMTPSFSPGNPVFINNLFLSCSDMNISAASSFNPERNSLQGNYHKLHFSPSYKSLLLCLIPFL